MHATSNTSSYTAARLAGATYIVASIGFLLVFGWLASHFGYPDVLDAEASTVLPQLIALGNDGRAVWLVYALLPLLLIPASIGAAAALADVDRDSAHPHRHASTLRLAAALQIAAALCMTAGLARWSTAMWSLGEAWSGADVTTARAITIAFDALNLYLGNAIGEFIGELLLYSSFAALALVLARQGARGLALLGAATALAGWVGMFRNITTSVDAIAEISNGLLPLFLIVFGATLMRRRIGVGVLRAAPMPTA